ncbi:MAG: STAS domain-containing protein [Isosphaeraceae bacterium]
MHPHSPLFELEEEGNVTLVRLLSDDLRQPFQAVELGEQLTKVIEAGRSRLLIDFQRLHYMGSTGFAILLVLARKARAAGGELRLLGMQEEVRFGANILGIGSIVELYDDEEEAIAAFGAP